MINSTSGTTAFNLTLSEIVEEAFERCGSEVRSGYDLKTARRSLNLLLGEWANRGINLWTMDSATIPLTPGIGTYALPADTVDLLEQIIRDTTNPQAPIDLTIPRISVSTYASIPVKTQLGRPVQAFIQRLESAPTITLWPVPDRSIYQLLYYRLRRIQDAGNGSNVQDVPWRFYNAMVAGLAYMLSMKLPDAFDRGQVLKIAYEEAWLLASDEDREKASVRLVPRILSAGG